VEIRGTIAIVTGGASGLGAQTARALRAAGATVAIVDRNGPAAEEVARELGARAFTCDVTDGDQGVQTIAAIVTQLGAPRILVHCAGIGTARRIVGRDGPIPLEEFERVVRVNLIGTVNMVRLVAAEMTKLAPLEDGERGVIVMTASVAAFDGQLGQAAYAASKGAIVSLTLPAAREFAQFGIRVVTIAPGFFETPLLAELPAEAQQQLIGAIPFPKRLGRPSEFAELALHAITNRSLNGATIRLDGALRLPPR